MVVVIILLTQENSIYSIVRLGQNKIIERYAYMLNIEDGFEYSEQICKMIKDVVEDLGINQKLEKIMIKHTPA